LTWSTV